jgi:hypothetical protein
MPTVKLRVLMRMQGLDDCYCGVRCLSTAAHLFGLSGRERREWKTAADRKLGIGRLKLVEIAKAMGMTVMRGRRWQPHHITDVQPHSVWLACIRCSLPYAKSKTGRWSGAHYVLVLAMRPTLVTIGDPYPQEGLQAVRNVPRSKFMQEWRRANNWAIELRPN